MGTVSTHQLSTFTTPVNGTSPIDANQVKGNDNSIKTSYNAHDADTTIHLQSGAVATRPAASTAGQTWLATDSGAVYLWLDNGSAWVEANYLRNTGGTVTGNVLITGTLGVTGATTLSSTLTIGGVTYTFPASQGANQYLKTDGSGNLSWVTFLETLALTDLSDVTITSASSGQFLLYNGTVWVNGTNGSALTTLNASNLSSGTVNTARIAGSYTGITAVGTLTAGAISTGFTAIADTYLATISTAGKVSNSATTATSANTASAIVARDASGNFTAGTITATLTGNADSATKLATARAINGVNFDGTAAITVPAAAGTLTGTTLASNVVTSSLTAVGTLVTGAIGTGFTAIPNSALANSSITLNGTVASLGSSYTLTAAAGTLTGTTLASNVTLSSLTTVGTLSAGAVPASLVTAGTFGAGAYTFPGALAITGAFTGATTGAFSGLVAIGGASSVTPYTALLTVKGAGGTFFVRDSGGEAYFYGAASPYYFGTAYAGSSLVLTSGNGTAALTLSSTQAATFASSLAINGAFTGATTGAFSSTITNTSGSLYLKAVSSGTGLGSATYQGWYLPDGTTPRAYLGYTSTNDPTFHVGPNESGGTLVLHYGAYSSGLTIGSTGAVAIPGTLAVTGAATFGAGGTSVVMNATSTYNAIRFNQSGSAQGFIGSDYGQAMCTTSANGDMVLRADVTGTILFASTTTQIGKLTTGTFALSDGQTIQWTSSSNRVFFNGGAFRVDVNGSQYLGISTAGAVTAAGVYSTTVGATNRDLYIDNTGLIGYVSSIRAAKTNITPLTDTSWLDALTPVAFNYRKKDEDGAWTDEANTPLEYGLIAEEVEGVNPELVFYDETEDGLALRGVSYNKLMIPLLQRVQALTARVAALEGV